MFNAQYGENKFGISTTSRYKPCVPWEELVVDIPETGELDPPRGEYLEPRESQPIICPVINYSDVRKYICTELPAVRFRLPRLGSIEREICLIWIEERGEWIAIQHDWWLETDLSIDESYGKARTLDLYSAERLLEAYGITENISLDRARRMKPDELKELR